MAEYDPNFQDSASPLWIPVGLVVLLAMPTLPMVIGWAKVLF
ncbi:hypothetical protein V6U78_00320 [Marinospirillum sp. MEB164]|uniref:Uncharacterized protein n=1 Tax=Marinospirillum alkalitolerans TaxID=3123374 RepID=A0ABW8PT67_9GAMM